MARNTFGARYGVAGSTVAGWEEEGKIAGVEQVNRLAIDGLVDHADWYTPALCARCEVRADDPKASACARTECPLAVRRVA